MLTIPPICDFDWKLPAFSLMDAEGVRHDSKDLMGENGCLIVFICNHCPYVIAIAKELSLVADRLQSDHGIKVAAINSNDFVQYPQDAPSEMPNFARKHGFNFPYLIDESQAVAREWDAVCTPDFFGFNQAGALQYRGRFYDRDQPAYDDQGGFLWEQNDLYKAMTQIAQTGKGPVHQISSMGCSIKWK